MATPFEQNLKYNFPGLSSTPFSVTSPYDPKYNCIAWAAGDNKRWWEPDPNGQYYWPPGVPREYTIEAYRQAFASLGYVECADGGFVDGFVKIALFSLHGTPTHASRQISPTDWTSKLGREIDISHQVQGLEGKEYGHAQIFLSRKL